MVDVYWLCMPRGIYRTRPVQFVVRLKQEEKDAIKEAADQAGQDMSNWIRRVALAAARKELRS